MLFWLKTSILRAKFYFLIFSILYFLAILQIDIYLYHNHFTETEISLSRLSFKIGFFSYLFMLFAVEFLVIQRFAHEMGNLETLGMRRWQYLLVYLLQFFASYVLAWLFSLIVFPFLQIFVNNPLSLLQLLAIYFFSFLSLGGFVLVTVAFSLVWHSRQDPFLLLKEKL